MSMNSIKQYKQVERLTSPARETEARVLTEGAVRLQRCRENWDNDDRSENLDEALRYNQRLWSVLQAALLSPDCPLPDGLRRDILTLSAFIDRQIFRAMANPSPELLKPIIDINRGLAEGLRAKPRRNGTVHPIAVKR